MGRLIKGLLLILIAVAAVIWGLDSAGLINIGTTGQLRAPAIEAKIDVSGGQMPDVQVETAKVSVGTKTETVSVPTGIDVGTSEAQVELPEVDIDQKAGDDGSANR